MRVYFLIDHTDPCVIIRLGSIIIKTLFLYLILYLNKLCIKRSELIANVSITSLRQISISSSELNISI